MNFLRDKHVYFEQEPFKNPLLFMMGKGFREGHLIFCNQNQVGEEDVLAKVGEKLIKYATFTNIYD